MPIELVAAGHLAVAEAAPVVCQLVAVEVGHLHVAEAAAGAVVAAGPCHVAVVKLLLLPWQLFLLWQMHLGSTALTPLAQRAGLTPCPAAFWPKEFLDSSEHTLPWMVQKW